MLVAIAAASACGPPDMHPPPGTLTVAFKPTPPSVANLTLSSVTLVVDRIMPIGNAPPPGPPPPTRLTIDALSTTGASLDFDHLPQGVYSRVQFSVDGVTVHGSWRGTPLTAMVGMFGGNQIDLRSSTGREIGPGLDATLSVAVDVSSWFAGDVLDGATSSGGQIVCDMQNNPMVTGQLSMLVNSSFTLQ
jgi:hypothetical protein